MREELVALALKWQKQYGVAPAVTSALSECDAAIFLVGMSELDYSEYMQDRTAVSNGHDFVFQGKKYQIKASRPSGKSGSDITNVGKAQKKDKKTREYKWDVLIWIRYNKYYWVEEAWKFDKASYGREFGDRQGQRLSLEDMREGIEMIVPDEISAKCNP